MSRVSRLLNAACLGAALTAAFFTAASAAEYNPVRAIPAAGSNAAGAARVIVKYKAGAKALAATTTAVAMPRGAAVMSARVGAALADGRSLGPRTQVLTASGLTSAELAVRLARESDVEWAVVDGRRYPQFIPDDPLYPVQIGGTSPAVGQWYLRPPAAPAVSAIDAQGAWSTTLGVPGFVIADIDTGITDHPDLRNQLYANGSAPYGYDFVGFAIENGETSDEAKLTANDGTLADPDPSDPGDWITTEENSGAVDNGFFQGCVSPPEVSENSTWHGTQTAAILAAQTDNAIGMAGMVPNAKVVPVRVLGKCGGFDSDIIAGMEWAAGVAVPGAPTNLHPAQVLNMSLGGSGDCTSAYQDVFDTLTALNVVVVVAAGNEEGAPLGVPANCQGAVSVVGLRHAGDKVGFSNLGTAALPATIAAPAGNCVNPIGQECIYPILSASNTGATSPVSPKYTSGNPGLNDATLGTSFSTPLVSGTVALMLSVSPNLTQPQLVTLLQASASPFPIVAGMPACTAATSGSTQDECNCAAGICGAGMLNARAAVLQATYPYPVIAGPVSAGVGDAVTLTADQSVFSNGRTVASFAWQLVGGAGIATLSATTGSSVTLTSTAAGTATVQLTVQDNTGASMATTQDVVFSNASSGGGGGAANPLWLLGLMSAGLALAPRRKR